MIKKIAGGLEILLGALWSFHHADTFYQYRECPDCLWLLIIPDWVLILNFLVGLVGIWMGIKVFQGRTTILQGYLVFFGACIVGLIAESTYHLLPFTYLLFIVIIPFVF